MKYIIKNCPAFNNDNFAECKDNNLCHIQCCDNNDCLLKQIVETCNVYRYMQAITLTEYAKREVALKILDKLEIEEVNEM